jgi:GAF domain-containing protein
MVRATRLLEAFIDFATFLAADGDAVEIGTELAARGAAALEVDEAAVALATDGTSVREFASSSPRALEVLRLELRHAEGPSLDAVGSGAVVAAPDALAARRRWPRFVPDAEPAGFRSFAAVPLRRRGTAVGALGLYARAGAALRPDDAPVAQALADLAALAIMHERAAERAEAVAAQLQTALDARVVIEQAKGVVAKHRGVNIDAAFTELRGYARRHHQLLTDVARRVVAGELDPTVLARR